MHPPVARALGRSVLLPLVLACLSVWPRPSLRAQAQGSAGVFLPVEGDLQLLRKRVEEARERGDWDAVVDGLGRFAEAILRPGANTVLPAGGGMALGLGRVFVRLKTGLPPEPSRRLEGRLDSVLRKSLEAAQAEGDAATVRELRRKAARDFSGSRLLPPILKASIDEALEEGRWSEVRQGCETLLERSPIPEQGTASPVDEDAGPIALTEDDRVRARILLARACAALGDGPGAGAQLAELKQAREAKGFDGLPGELRQVVEAMLAAGPGSPGSMAARTIEENPLRPEVLPGETVAREDGIYRLGSPIWDRGVTSSRARLFLAEQSRSSPMKEAPLPYHAAARNGKIAVQHADRVSLFDTVMGRELWSCPIDPATEDLASIRSPLVSEQAVYFVDGRTLHALRIEDGTPLWERSAVHDRSAKKLSFVELFPAAEAPDEAVEEPRPPVEGEAKPEGEPEKHEEKEAEKDGKADADEGAKKSDNAEKEAAAGDGKAGEEERKGNAPGAKRKAVEGPAGAGAPGADPRKKLPHVRYSLTPPAACRGGIVLGVHVRIGQETLVNLVALDAAGRTRWTTFLGSSQGGNYLGLGDTGSPPLVDGGEIFHLTNSGFVAALDDQDGAIQWIAEYSRLTARGKRESIRDENRWQPNPILPVGREILIAPQDSPHMLAIARKTGEIIWRLPREGRSVLIGADQRSFFVAGKDIARISLGAESRGKVLWRFAGSGTSASLDTLGRGFLTPEALLLPARDAFYSLSRQDGRVLSRTLWDFAGGAGNLLLATAAPGPAGAAPSGKVLVVMHPSAVLVYDDYQKEKTRVEALPPGEADGLLRRAKFELKNGEIEAGLSILRAWKQSAPPAPVPNSPLDHLHLDLAEIVHQLSRGDGSPPHRTDLLRFRVYLERTPQRRVEAAVRLAEKLEDDTDPAGALAAYHDALSFDQPATELAPDGQLRVPSAAYVRSRIRALRRSTPHPDLVFSGVDAAAAEALRRAQNKLKTPAAYAEVVRLYPYTPAAAEAFFEMARLFRDAQSLDQAIKALEGYLRDYPGGTEAVKAKLLAASLLNQTGHIDEARGHYVDLLERHGAARVDQAPGARPGETVEGYVKPILLELNASRPVKETSPELRFPVRLSWRSPADLQATKRTFMTPVGVPPAGLKRCFLTQSQEVLECRELDTGLPRWRVQLELVPGFEFDESPFGRGFRYSMLRVGRRALNGRYVRPPEEKPRPGDRLLVLHDERNILALDADTGLVRWHVPIGREASVKDPAEPVRPLLREKLRGAAVTDSGVFAATTHGRLLHWNLHGEAVWERASVGYAPAPQPLHLLGDDLVVHAQQPVGIRFHDASTGEERDDDEIAAIKSQIEGPLQRAPIEVAGTDPESPGRLLLTLAKELVLLDLEKKAIVWSYSAPKTIEDVAFFPEYPDECLVFLNRANNLPVILAVSLRDGRELWQYQKFPAVRASLTAAREENRIYVLHGTEEQWSLYALQVRRRGDDEPAAVEPLWPSEIKLGHRVGGLGAAAGRIHLGGDSLLLEDPEGSISVFDKVTGRSKSSQAQAISRFLTEKEEKITAVIDGKLIILSDGGDCAFESATASRPAGLVAPGPSTAPESGDDRPAGDVPREPSGEPEVALLEAYLAHPGSLENTVAVALHYFRNGERESAINVLNRALLSEDLLRDDDAPGDGTRLRRRPGAAEKRYLLSYLLDGIKEEFMKESVPRIHTRRFATPPEIDGELNDAWDVSRRVRLDSPANVGTIPGPSQARDWDGEEDLSGVLYTGWDDEYFYFALDVTDDMLYPYDREAETWRGDCLIIGLDPTNDGGYYQRGNDQLMTLALTIPKRNKLDKQKKKDGEQGADEEEDEEAGPKPDGLFHVKKKDDDSGAVYEVGLPWASFSNALRDGPPPPSGYVFGLSLLLTDDDTGQGATKTLSLNSCHLLPRNQRNSAVWRFIIPYYFPRVTLE